MRWLDALIQDLRFAFRMLWKNPGFTLVAVLTLALGIGANTAIFSVVQSVLLRPLPFREPGRLVMLWERNPEVFEEELCSGPNALDWERESSSFEKIGFLYNRGPWARNFMMSVDEQPMRLRARIASSGFFDVLGVKPLLGRTFTPDDDPWGNEKTAVLSYPFWQRLYAGDPNVIGQQMDLHGGTTIVGVMPPGFRLPPDAEVWLSFSSIRTTSRDMNGRGVLALWTFGRLKPGGSAAHAQTELSIIQRQIAKENPELKRIGTEVKVVPLLKQLIGTETRPALLVLLGAVAFVLMIACANVANLLLARAGARQKEIAVRTALGAGRWRVVRQLLTESLLLAVCGGALGVLFAVWGVQALGAMSFEETFMGVKEFRVNRITEVSLNADVLLFTLAVSLATGVVFGLVPALQAVKVNVNESLKADSRGASGGVGRQRLDSLLLVSEVAVALMLLIGAGVMMQGFLRMQQVETGVRTEGVVKFEVDLQMAQRKYSGGIQDVTYEIMQRVRSMPGTVALGSAGEMPLIKSGWQAALFLEGRPWPDAEETPQTDIRIITPGLFESLGAPLLAGRDVSEDDHGDSPPVCVVNKTFADRFLPGETPIGKRVGLGAPGRWIEIVGVVGTVRNFSTQSEDSPEVYPCYRQNYWGGAELGPTFVLRTTLDTSAMMAAIRREVEGPNRETPIINKVQTIQSILASSVATERLRTTLLTMFGGVALLLATVGIYGVMSYSVSRRTQEIGIRMALGADAGSVRRMIVWKGLKLTLAGVVIGLAAAYAVTRLLASQIPWVESTEPVSYVTIPAFLTLVAFIACLLPARRATRINPVVALRHE